MEINYQITCRLPEDVLVALGINEDTAFETYFEDGAIHIRPLTDEDLESLRSEQDEDEDEDCCTGNCEDCALDDCCPYDECETDYDCRAEDCEDCEYFCHRCGSCVLADETEDDE